MMDGFRFVNLALKRDETGHIVLYVKYAWR